MESHGSRKPPRYVSYLLRMWQTLSGGQWVWRCSLEDPLPGRQNGFKDIQRLIDFLQRQIDASTGQGGDYGKKQT
jgi:hypothetical protein